ncbi:MAG: subclass B1 metallo-beta-lactamase, partial [Cyclobacteriaceae bacterium]|nr:subclass B1 metallo-beta-lactamase [Cyclobacteriaceae bacterium]
MFFLFFVVSTSAQQALPKLEISRLAENFYVYTTYSNYQGHRIPANGLYFLTDRGAVIIDSPWDTTQFQPLLDSIKVKHNKNVVMCIATHFHEDRTAGLEYYRSKGIKTYTTKRTDELSIKRGMKRAEFLIGRDTMFTVGQYSFKVIYPGHGHTPDNIVLWFEKEKILYGGCLIKSREDKPLGNLADASVK